MTETERVAEHRAKMAAENAALVALPEGHYCDGTYEWLKLDEDDWTPVNAPSGMASRPRYEGLRKVVKTYVALDSEDADRG